MNVFIVLAAASSVALCGCKNPGNEPRPQVPMPMATPFDSDAMQREAYRHAFAEGYRAARGTGTTSGSFFSGPYSRAREMGWRAGVAAGREE
jgi:hypothetical protein